MCVTFLKKNSFPLLFVYAHVCTGVCMYVGTHTCSVSTHMSSVSV